MHIFPKVAGAKSVLLEGRVAEPAMLFINRINGMFARYEGGKLYYGLSPMRTCLATAAPEPNNDEAADAALAEVERYVAGIAAPDHPAPDA